MCATSASSRLAWRCTLPVPLSSVITDSSMSSRVRCTVLTVRYRSVRPAEDSVHRPTPYCSGRIDHFPCVPTAPARKSAADARLMRACGRCIMLPAKRLSSFLSSNYRLEHASRGCQPPASCGSSGHRGLALVDTTRRFRMACMVRAFPPMYGSSISASPPNFGKDVVCMAGERGRA